MDLRKCSCGELFEVNPRSRRRVCKDCRENLTTRPIREVQRRRSEIIEDENVYTPRFDGTKYFDEFGDDGE